MIATEDRQLEECGRLPLPLPGWSLYSVWGWDEGGLYAQLWRDTDSPREAPRRWLCPATGYPATADVEVLAERIAMAAGVSELAAVLAMADQAPGEAGEHLRAYADWLTAT